MGLRAFRTNINIVVHQKCTNINNYRLDTITHINSMRKKYRNVELFAGMLKWKEDAV